MLLNARVGSDCVVLRKGADGLDSLDIQEYCCHCCGSEAHFSLLQNARSGVGRLWSFPGHAYLFMYDLCFQSSVLSRSPQRSYDPQVPNNLLSCPFLKKNCFVEI